MAYVYTHTNPITNYIFYIGMGKVSNRIISTHNRNPYWHNTVNKYGFEAEMIYNNLTWESAQEIEIFLIKLYGRKDLKKGLLCNMTDGGEGTHGRKHTKESKIKMSKAHKGKKYPNRQYWKPPKLREYSMEEIFS